MKLAFVVSALSLLSTSLGFAPASSRIPLRTTSALQSWFKDYQRECETKKKEACHKNNADEFVKTIARVKNEIEVERIEDMTDDEDIEDDKTCDKYQFDHYPAKKYTGVDTHITRLCATISAQAYSVHNGELSDYKLNTEDHKVKIIFQETQGIFRPSSPNFVACVTGDTMILCWRGTAFKEYPLDALNDLAFSPTSSIAWRKHAKTLKMQGAMTSLCCNDICGHEETIIAACKDHGINEIVTTGHSLGGGIGQIGHTILRAQMQDENSPWSKLNGVNVRSVVFSAPMTTVIVDDDDDYSKETEAFIDELHLNSCNLVYSNDVIPRSYAHLKFMNAFLDDAISNLLPYLREGKKLKPGLINIIFKKIVRNKKNALIKKEMVFDMLSVMDEYIHPGNIVYYKTAQSEPRILKDYGEYDKNWFKKDRFRSATAGYKPSKDPFGEFMSWHCDIINGPGLSYADSELH